MTNTKINIKSMITSMLHLLAWFGLLWILVVAFQYKKEVNIIGIELSIVNPENQVHLIEAGSLTQFVLQGLEDSIQNYRLSDLPLKSLFNNLNEHPYVKHARLFVSSEGVLKIECQPRHPVARVVPARGDAYFVDKVGKSMPLSIDVHPRLPIVRGRVPQVLTENDEELLDLVRLGEFFTMVKNSPFLDLFVDQLVVTALKEYIAIPALGTEKIELGEWERMQEKLWDLEDFYTEVIAQVGWGKYEKISFKYEGQIVGTRKTTATP